MTDEGSNASKYFAPVQRTCIGLHHQSKTIPMIPVTMQCRIGPTWSFIYQNKHPWVGLKFTDPLTYGKPFWSFVYQKINQWVGFTNPLQNGNPLSCRSPNLTPEHIVMLSDACHDDTTLVTISRCHDLSRLVTIVTTYQDLSRLVTMSQRLSRVFWHHGKKVSCICQSTATGGCCVRLSTMHRQVALTYASIFAERRA